MTTIGLRHPAVDAALATAATLLDMELVFVGSLSDETFTFERVHGVDWPGVAEGLVSDRTDSFCHRMLAGAPSHTSDAATDEAYLSAPIGKTLGIASYVGVPIRDADGVIVGTLCGLDRDHIAVSDAAIGVMHELANIVAIHMSDDLQTSVIRRTPEGWQVGTESTDDLVSAMVLADLLAGDITRPNRPARAEASTDELARLKVTVAQLEHALAARVTIEQAIGVLAERHHITPQAAFDLLRRVSRSAGLRIHEVSRVVVSSTTAPADLPLGLL